MDVVDTETVNHVTNLKAPTYLAQKPYNPQLEVLTLGQLMEIQYTETFLPKVELYMSLVCGCTTDEYMNEHYEKVMGAVNHITDLLNNVGAMFSGSRIKPTREEITAGVESLNFGAFGLIDWYSQRQKITHEQAEATPWTRVFNAIKKDNDTEIYRRKLMKIHSKQNKK